jgi:hypothetical protein
MKRGLKIYRVEFEPIWPVGCCLIIAAMSQEEAEEIASNTCWTDTFKVTEVELIKSQVIEYMSGDY